jgi:alpha-tubulin suppressor-like RCC1 family protein
LKKIFLFFLPLFLLTNTVALSQDLGTSPEVKQLAAGTGHGIALLIDGTVWAWGKNTSGQLGDSSRVDKYIPVKIGTDSNWCSITAGNSFSHGVKKDGTLWGWGANKVGQLGISTANIIYDYTMPVQIGADKDWLLVSSGISFTIGLKKDGTVWGWGNMLYNLQDQESNSYKPVKLTGDDNSNWATIAAGDDFFIAQKKDGTLWTRGVINDLLHNYGGKNIFYKVSDDTDWANFDAGKRHAVAIKKDGSLWAWGKNEMGQLGNGSNSTAKNPLRIGREHDWKTVTAGGNYTITLKKDGTVWHWGQTIFIKDKVKYNTVPKPFNASVKYNCIAAATDRLLLTYAKAKMQGIVENFALGEDGTMKSFITPTDK